MTFYERASGSRLHANYFRTGGVHQDLPTKLIEDIGKFCKTFPKILDDLEDLLTDNRIFKQRNVEIGIVTKQEALRSQLFRCYAKRFWYCLGFKKVSAI